MIHRHHSSTLFPYTTLFRSVSFDFGATLDGYASDFGRTVFIGEPDPELLVCHKLIMRSEEHTSELQSLTNLVCRLLLEKKNRNICSSLSTNYDRIMVSRLII